MEHIFSDGDPNGRVDETTKNIMEVQDIELLALRRADEGFKLFVHCRRRRESEEKQRIH